MSQKTKRLGQCANTAEPRFNSVREDKKMNAFKNSAAYAATATPVAIDIFAEMNELISKAENLAQLLDTAAINFGELDFGTGETRNHAMDRVFAIVDVSRDLSERLASDISRLYPEVTSKAKSATVSDLKALDFTGWGIVDFELAYDGFRNIELGAASVYNQPRAMSERRTDYVAGAAFFRDLVEDWIDHKVNDLIEHLKGIRFKDAEEDDRRLRLILRFALDHSLDPERPISAICNDIVGVAA